MNAPVIVGLLVAAAVAAMFATLRWPGRSRRAEVPVEDAASRPASRAITLVGTSLASAVVGLVAGPAPLVIVALAVAGVRPWRRRRSRRRQRDAAVVALPDATEVFVACLHAGCSPTQAIAEVARLGPVALRPAFDAVDQRLHRSHGVSDALDELVERIGPSALPLVTATSAALRDGLPLAPLLDRLTDEAMASRRRQGEAAARRLPVRLSLPLVVCTLPAFVLLSIAPAILGALGSLRVPSL